MGIFSGPKKRRKLINQMMNTGENTGLTGPGDPPTFFRRCWIFLKSYWLNIGLPVCGILFLCLCVYYYNNFIALMQNVENMKAQIESCLQRRENLVPVLQIALADFVRHENNVFLKVTDMRSSVHNSKPSIQNTQSLDGLLSKLFAVAERYPDIKVSESFQLLMSETSKVEKEILDKRIEYNNAARELNIKVATIPSGIIAWPLRIKKALYFQWKGKPEWVTTLEEKTTITDEKLDR